MVETILPGVSGAVPIARIAPPPRKEFLNPDGSAIPDIIAYHHRPYEDLGDMSDQRVPDESDTALFGKDGMTFGDLLDIINPLQHIPIVSTLYRAMTGDEISPGARMVGGALFGGPFGLGIAIVNAAVEASTGEDIGDTILTALTGGDPAIPAPAAAAAKPAETAAPATHPAKFGAVTMPVRLPLNARGAGQRPNNPTASMPDQPPAAVSAAFFRPAGLPYGGIGTLPFATPFQDNDDPVAAVLRARSAVPSGGPVRGLGRAPLGAIDRQPPRPDRSPPPPIIDQRLADKLSALSAKTAARSAPPKPAGDTAAVGNPIERNGAPAALPQYTPAGAISQTMLNALDRYQRMKKMETGNPSG